MRYAAASSVARWGAIAAGAVTSVLGIQIMLRFFARTAAWCAVLCASLAVAQDRENFDIRLSTEKSDVRALDTLRGADASPRFIATQQRLQAAEDTLRNAKPHLAIIPSVETGVAEVIGVSRGAVELTARSNAAPALVARDFLRSQAGLYGLSAAQVDALTLDADYANPAGNMRWVRFTQRVNDRPLFRGYVTVALNRHGQVVRTTGQLAGGIVENEAIDQVVLEAEDALGHAAESLGVLPASAPVRVSTRDSGRSVTFEWPGESLPIKTEQMYFPLGAGKLELAWSTMVPDGDAVYMVVLSAIDGTVLFRKNLTNEAAYNYTVYPGDNPAPLSPGPIDPTLGTQGVRISPSVMTIESLILSQPTANNPWIPAGGADTQGNNAIAGLDISAPDGVDATVPTNGAQAFNYVSNPPPGVPIPGDDVNTAASRNAAVVNLFYWTNRFHDATYEMGFTEQAFNFQNDNYGRGGAGGDRVSAEAQDSSGTNNANFSTPADGSSGRMQMYIWTGPTPDRDGSLDAEIIIHEYTHGLSNRLHGNATGLSTQMAGGMGEGWGDFYAHSLLSEPTDPINGVYALGGYSLYQAAGAGFTGNYYYGIRRFPKAIISATGGPGNLPFNPLTFADIDSTQINLADGAFPPGPFGTPNAADQVHNAGEIWSTALWEARAKVIGIHGPTAGNQRMLQLVTDGMKLNPAAPTFLDARDSIIAATCAGFAGEDETALWEGFALRGMGYSARITSIVPARVVEAFDAPIGGALDGTTQTNLSCGMPGRAAAPGETLELAVTITNTFCATALQNLVVSIPGGDSVTVGELAAGASVTPILLYTIPDAQACGTSIDVPLEFTSDLGTGTGSYTVQVGEAATNTIAFSTAVSTAIPGAGTIGVAAPYPSTVAVAGVTEPVVGLTLTLTNYASTYFGDSDLLLVSPTGGRMVVFSDVVSSFGGASPVTITLDDAAAAVAPATGTLVDGASYRPTDHVAGDTFAAPAPAGPYQTPAPTGAATFASFAGGTDVNGVWSLYAVDDVSGDIATLGGWTLGIIVAQPVVCDDCMLSVGGTLTGLAPGASVTLQNNGTDDLVLNADSPFTFPTLLLRGESYEVTVATQPGTPPQLCTVANDTGTLTGPNVDNVVVTCANAYSVGGNVSGLAGAGLELQLNGGVALPIAADGAFVFPQTLLDNDPYEITVATQPGSPDQACTVTGGNGTIAGSDALGATVNCVGVYPIGGTVTGLAPGASVELQLNGSANLVVNADSAFEFGTLLPNGPYSVTVLTQPTEQTCVVAGGEGSVTGAAVTTVEVTCTTNLYSVGGNASGIAAGDSVTLVINGGETLLVDADGTFTFGTELASGTVYSVTIDNQTSAEHVCTLANGDGTVNGADVADLVLLCRTFPIFANGFED